MEGKGRMFFFEKKNQKTFIRGLCAVARHLGSAAQPSNKSLFASFSSEKEVLAFFYGS
jgi:hypothetical protein